jgi:hypothetical protein
VEAVWSHTDAVTDALVEALMAIMVPAGSGVA